MTLLAYCVTETSAAVEAPYTGVAGSPIQNVEHDDLRCFVSPSTEDSPLPASQLREAALAFHRVIDKIFHQTAIIPFRFPTLLAGEPELIAYLAEHSVEYGAALTRLRDMVQMEIRLKFKGSTSKRGVADSSGVSGAEAKPSGTAYLQKISVHHEKLEVAAKELRQACLSSIRGWRQRDLSEGIRCFALVERGSVGRFQTELRTVGIEPALEARLSGPWPASQFLKEE